MARVTLKVEFHCHTEYSKDSLTTIPQLVRAARRRGLDRLVVTDHNTIQGALAAKEFAPDLIIVGEEIKTKRGELLAAFVTEEVPAGLLPEEAIRRLRAQGAFISVSHPFDLGRNGWELDDLDDIRPLVDAIEVFNSRCVNPQYNQQALKYAQDYDLAGTVGSDAHAAFEIGRAVLEIAPFDSAAELCEQIRTAQVITKLSSPWVHFTSMYARIQKSRQKKAS
jgi:predicted metal-dependent phosphoesterase TrpH